MLVLSSSGASRERFPGPRTSQGDVGGNTWRADRACPRARLTAPGRPAEPFQLAGEKPNSEAVGTRAPRRSLGGPHPLCPSPVRSGSPEPQQRGRSRAPPVPCARSTPSRSHNSECPRPPRRTLLGARRATAPTSSGRPGRGRPQPARHRAPRAPATPARLRRGGAGPGRPRREGHPVRLRSQHLSEQVAFAPRAPRAGPGNPERGREAAPRGAEPGDPSGSSRFPASRGGDGGRRGRRGRKGRSYLAAGARSGQAGASSPRWPLCAPVAAEPLARAAVSGRWRKEAPSPGRHGPEWTLYAFPVLLTPVGR